MQINHRLREVALLFLKLGITAFGGPAAHIAMMRDEVVKRRKWVDDQHFLDMLGATNLIPGPNSTEMTIHLGLHRAGWKGLIAGGACFILPAMLIVMAIAWGYVHFGTSPEVSWLLYGVKPVVIAIIVQALLGLGQKAVKGFLTAIIGLAVLILYFLGVNEILLLFAGGFAALFAANLTGLGNNSLFGAAAPIGGLSLPAALTAVTPVKMSHLFLIFLKIGSVLYGSGYVLLAFLRADFVVRLGWLTDQQLIDAIAIGQVTPGPVFTTATFIGYILGGFPGAILATIGIFLPSFIFVAISNPLIPRLRQSASISSFLDGVNISSLGLMAAVTIQLSHTSLIDPLTIIIAVISAILLFYLRINSTWLIAGGAAAGLIRSFLT